MAEVHKAVSEPFNHNEKRGAEAKLKTAAREDILKKKATMSHVPITLSPKGQERARKTPMPVATPFPPLKFNQQGNR